jgi:uncharacterized protein
MLLPRGKRWIQSRLTLLVLLGFIHALVFWDGDILLAYGLIGLISWRMIRDAQSVKALFNTGLALYLIGIVVLLLLGLSPVARPTVHGYLDRPISSMKSGGKQRAA